MRNRLASNKEVRKKFHAVFRRFGKKVGFSGYTNETVLLIDVRDAQTQEVLTDHVWFAYTRGFERIRLQPGVKVEFEARIKAYKKGYVNRRLAINERKVDYKLSNPTRIIIVSDASQGAGER